MLFILIAIVVIIIGIFAFGYFYGSRHFVVRQQTIYFDNLPKAFDGYRILHFSDFHARAFKNGHKEDVEKIVNLINEQKCDMVAFTGDLVTCTSSELFGFEDQLSRISAPDGVFSVMGNHDYARYTYGWSPKKRKADIQQLHSLERQFGWNLLLNQHTMVKRGGDSIAVIGLENDGTPPHFPQYGNVKAATEGLDKSTFQIMLSHDPTSWDRRDIPHSDIMLTLSGHTHSGQFNVFGLTVVKKVYKQWEGLYSENGRKLYISAGVGCVPFPFRVGAWPEVNVLTLKRADKGSQNK